MGVISEAQIAAWVLMPWTILSLCRDAYWNVSNVVSALPKRVADEIVPRNSEKIIT
jgi:hypothetical protein